MADVAQISSVHPTFDTRIFEKCCKTLVEHGWSVDLIVQADRAETVSGVNVVPLAKPSSRWARLFKTGPAAMELALQSGATVCHIHDPELLLWSWKLTRRGRTVIFDMHENLPAAIRSKDWLPVWLRPLVSRVVQGIERILLRNKYVILAETSYIDDYRFLKQSLVLQNFPRVSHLQQIKVEKRPVKTLVYLGHIHWTRGSTTMVEALGRLAAEDIEAELLLIGRVPPDHQVELQRLADKFGVRVEFVGHLAPTEAWSRVAACHVGMAVLSPEKNYVNSYPTKLFEYMALGLPVVTSNFPLYRQVVEDSDCGFAVDPLDLEAVTDAIRQLVTDDASAARSGSHGRAAASERYNWEREQSGLIDLYSSLVK